MLTSTQAAVVVIVSILLTVASYYSVRSVRQLRSLGAQPPSPDSQHFRRQARRRFINCVLMFALAGLIAWPYVSGMEARMDELIAQRGPDAAPLTPDEQAERWFYLRYWGIVLIALTTVVMLAVVDFWDTQRYVRRQLAQLRTANREALEHDLAELRKQRRLGQNGQV